MRCRPTILAVAVLCAVAVCQSGEKAAPVKKDSPYLFIWSGDAARKSSDFLAVVDADPKSAKYGQIVATAPVGITGSMPHHTEYEFPADNHLFANSWVAGRTFIFDLNNPLQPRVSAKFDDRDGYRFPHSFVRLPNGHLLGTFQSHGKGYAPGGGLVEVDTNGEVIRSGSAVDPSVNTDFIWPYSLAVLPDKNLVVSSNTPMSRPEWAPVVPESWPTKKIDAQMTEHVQIWRLSDLHLLSTVALPPDGSKHERWPAEPRVLPDGSVYVNTFSCGLYQMKDLGTAKPSAKLVYAFPGNGDSMDTVCAVPVIVGHFLIQTVGALPGLVVLDISNPEKPVKVSELELSHRYHMPHWLAADRDGRRIVVTGDDQNWVLIVNFDQEKGTLSIDEKFRDAGATAAGVSFDRQEWPHGKTGAAVVHGAVFGPR